MAQFMKWGLHHTVARVEKALKNGTFSGVDVGQVKTNSSHGLCIRNPWIKDGDSFAMNTKDLQSTI